MGCCLCWPDNSSMLRSTGHSTAWSHAEAKSAGKPQHPSVWPCENCLEAAPGSVGPVVCIGKPCFRCHCVQVQVAAGRPQDDMRGPNRRTQLFVCCLDLNPSPVKSFWAAQTPVVTCCCGLLHSFPVCEASKMHETVIRPLWWQLGPACSSFVLLSTPVKLPQPPRGMASIGFALLLCGTCSL